LAETVLPSLAAIGILGIACQWLAWRLRLPAILFLLLGGILAGPVTGVLDPDTLLGDLLFPIVSLSVAVILFEGGLTLRFDQIRGLTAVVRNLVTVGALLTWLLVALAGHFLCGLPGELALLFGAISVVTGPTVIIPMLRTVRLTARLARLLRWEGIVIDPIGALLAVVVFDFVAARYGAAPGGATADALLAFGAILATGAALGLAAGAATGWVLQRRLIPEYLRNLFVLTAVVALFVVADAIEKEAGLLAVTLMGITLANMPEAELEDIAHFKEHVSLMLVSTLFILLAARIEFDPFLELGWATLAILCLLAFPIRAVSVAASTWGSDLSWRERALLSWISPRGIVAAAVSAAFALRLEEIGYADGGLLVPLVLVLILFTVIVQGLTAGAAASWLGVTEPAPRGALILGCGIVGRRIGKALSEQGIPVLLADSDWDNIRQARMEGLPVYYGNALSEHAEENMDLSGLGHLLALSGRPHLNALAALRFRREFGPDKAHELQSDADAQAPESPGAKHRVSARHRGRRLFAEHASYATLAPRLRGGAEIRATPLSEEFGFADYREKFGASCIPLFALDANRQLRIFHAGVELKPEPGWVVLGLRDPGDAD